ncbi:hypothetical protein PAPYR_3800 [Paratrimastix pyriformis]|uniref:EamA domain-containing protein n=1 Tax=Paratrimastix pyriformis TaxID=342808 RepID=A0ABQ8ULK6_9EUKA|nr:hypothetical protein PAPYR_3800 [Paratrimastix pyriformis]
MDRFLHHFITIATEALPHLALILGQFIGAGLSVFTRFTMLEEVDPFVFSSLRCIIAFPCLFVLAAFFERGNTHRVTKRALPLLLTYSFLGIVVPLLTFAIGLKFTGASNFSFFIPLTPVITTAIAVATKAERWSWLKVGGLFLGLVGTGFFIWNDSTTIRTQFDDFNHEKLWGAALAIVNVVASAISFNLQFPLVDVSGRYDYKIPPLTVMTWATGLGGGVILVISIYFWVTSWHVWPTVDAIGWVGIVYAGIIQSCVNFSLSLWALKRVSRPSLVGAYSLLSALLGPLLATLTLGEIITQIQIWGGFFTITGLGLVIASKFQEEAKRRKALEAARAATLSGARPPEGLPPPPVEMVPMEVAPQPLMAQGSMLQVRAPTVRVPTMQDMGAQEVSVAFPEPPLPRTPSVMTSTRMTVVASTSDLSMTTQTPPLGAIRYQQIA